MSANVKSSDSYDLTCLQDGDADRMKGDGEPDAQLQLARRKMNGELSAWKITVPPDLLGLVEIYRDLLKGNIEIDPNYATLKKLYFKRGPKGRR